MKKTLVVSDLDGTLLTREDSLSPFTLETLQGLMEGGLLFTYATARSFSSASKVVKGLSLTVPGGILAGADAKAGHQGPGLTDTPGPAGLR